MKVESKPRYGQLIINKDILERRGCGSSPDKCGFSRKDFLHPNAPVICELEKFSGDTKIYAVKPVKKHAGILREVKVQRTIYCAFDKTQIKRIYSPEVSPTS